MTTTTHEQTTIRNVSPRDLVPHPHNIGIYGEDDPPADFLESVRSSGIIEPLVVKPGGTLVSGHRRLAAAKAIGLQTVPVREVAFATDAAEREAILNHNHYRTKTFSQRMREAEYAEETAHQKAKERQRLHGGTAPGQTKKHLGTDGPECSSGRTRDRVAKSVGLGSGKTYERASEIWQAAQAGDTNAATLIEAVDAGDQTVSRAHRKFREAKQRHERNTARSEAARSAPKLDTRVIIGDFRDNADRVADGSVSLIFTDPPYPRKYTPVFADMARFAEAKLCEGGSLIFYIGQTQLFEAGDVCREHLRYWWTISCRHAGGDNLMFQYGVSVGWKPCLWFVKGTRDDTSVTVSDTMAGGREKAGHEWQQAESEAAYWIEQLCPSDGLVVDPFLGSGTTAAAAEALQRGWIGFEADEQTAATANARLAGVRNSPFDRT